MYFLCPDAPPGYGPRIFLVDRDPGMENSTNISHQFLIERCCWGGSDKTIEAPIKDAPRRVFRGYEFIGESSVRWRDCLTHLREMFGEPMTREQVMRVY